MTLSTRLLVAAFSLLSLLPLRLLYCISDIGFVLMYYVVGYRRRIVRQNICSAFPEKDDAWVTKTERGFYRWFCDYFMEAVKLLTISDRQLRRRFTVEGADEVEKCFSEGQDAAAILGHYCNWEWLSCVGIALKPERKCGLIYHPLRSQAFDILFQRLRSLFGYIADQGPKWENIHLWLPFLNHDTPVFTGAERIMRKMHDAVFYIDMTRPRRGYYTCRFHLITRTPQDLPEYEVTRRFFQFLEQTIRRDPRFYLWSHNRWKRTHEEFDRKFIVVDGKVLPRK